MNASKIAPAVGVKIILCDLWWKSKWENVIRDLDNCLDIQFSYTDFKPELFWNIEMKNSWTYVDRIVPNVDL